MASISMFTLMKSRLVAILSVTAATLLLFSVNVASQETTTTLPPPLPPVQPAGGNLPSCLINCRLKVISCASGCRYGAGPFPFYIRFCIGQCAVQNFRCIQSCVNPTITPPVLPPPRRPILPPIFHRPPHTPILPPIFHRPPHTPILPPIFHRPPHTPILPPIFHRPPAEPILPPAVVVPKSSSVVVQSTDQSQLQPQPPLAAPDHDHHHVGKRN